MSLFSERMGYKEIKTIQYESLDVESRNRIYNVINNRILKFYDKGAFFKFIADEFFKIRHDYYNSHYIELIEKTILDGDWDEVFSFIEFFARFADDVNGEHNRYEFEVDINYVLEAEVTGYRLSNKLIIPITDEQELESINRGQKTMYESVNIHMKKALSLFSDRKSPDYENSIKESISAVEAIACIIVNNDNAVLSSALDRLVNKGVRIHSAQKDAFKKLYGYTSDENGIRHAGIDFNGATSEDARFMMISCSAFVHYLIEKNNELVDSKMSH